LRAAAVIASGAEPKAGAKPQGRREAAKRRSDDAIQPACAPLDRFGPAGLAMT